MSVNLVVTVDDLTPDGTQTLMTAHFCGWNFICQSFFSSSLALLSHHEIGQSLGLSEFSGKEDKNLQITSRVSAV